MSSRWTRSEASRNGDGHHLGPRREDSGRPRIVLYSHDTQGLGHVRRNLLISRALCQGGASPVILLLSGLRETAAFAMPQGVDCLTLPSLGKNEDGTYHPRSLGVTMDDLIDVRSKSIIAALRSFEPDALIVDKVPLGAFDELLPSLRMLKTAGRTRLILGLREILDDPARVQGDWRSGGFEAAIRDFYDRVWVYGDRAVYDTAREYGFAPDIAEITRSTGYLNFRDVPIGDRTADATDVPTVRRLEAIDGRVMLCVVGGGRDGLPLAEAFLRSDPPADASGVLVTGPLMPAASRAALNDLAATRPRMHVLEFVTDPCPLLERADRVIAMGGYNTTCEILSYGKPALIVPRVTPRTEQLIRATRFAEQGLVDMLHPDLCSPPAISRWMARDARPAHPAGACIDFDGVRRLPELLDEVLTSGRPAEERTHAAG